VSVLPTLYQWTFTSYCECVVATVGCSSWVCSGVVLIVRRRWTLRHTAVRPLHCLRQTRVVVVSTLYRLSPVLTVRLRSWRLRQPACQQAEVTQPADRWRCHSVEWWTDAALWCRSTSGPVVSHQWHQCHTCQISNCSALSGVHAFLPAHCLDESSQVICSPVSGSAAPDDGVMRHSGNQQD